MSAVSSEIFIESVADDARERASNVIFIELVYAHRRGIILARESTAAAFAGVPRCFRLRLIRVQASLTLRSACKRSFGTAEVAGVATRRFSRCFS